VGQDRGKRGAVVPSNRREGPGPLRVAIEMVREFLGGVWMGFKVGRMIVVG
jgi:hypothetical protein